MPWCAATRPYLMPLCGQSWGECGQGLHDRTARRWVAQRLGRGQDGQWLLRSEHPGWPAVPLSRTAAVTGAVRWMARTL